MTISHRENPREISLDVDDDDDDVDHANPNYNNDEISPFLALRRSTTSASDHPPSVEMSRSWKLSEMVKEQQVRDAIIVPERRTYNVDGIVGSNRELANNNSNNQQFPRHYSTGDIFECDRTFNNNNNNGNNEQPRDLLLSRRRPASLYRHKRQTTTVQSADTAANDKIDEGVPTVSVGNDNDNDNNNNNSNGDKRTTIDEQSVIDAGAPPPIDDSLFFDREQGPSLQRTSVDVANLKRSLRASLSSAEPRIPAGMEKGENLNTLILSTVEPSSATTNSNVALLWACFTGRADILPTIVADKGADKDFVDPATGMTALLTACLMGDLACAKYLIVDNGVDANYTNSKVLYTPLHLAAFNDRPEIVELLLDNGAKSGGSTWSEIEPVLHCAVRARSERAVKILLDRLGSADATTTTTTTTTSVGQKNHLGETPLHVACLVQSCSCARMLLQSKNDRVDPNALDWNLRTPLHFAVMHARSSPTLVQLLLKHGADVNRKDRQRLTALHVASLNEQSECVDLLIWAGADVSAATKSGLTALNIILRKIPECLQVFRQKLDASIRLTRPVPHNREFEMRLHFDFLFPSDDPCETSFINTFVQEHQKDLLSHPLVMAFLHLKWEKIRKFYLIRIFLYALTVVFMTTYVLTALAYKCYNLEASSSKICNNKRLSGFLFRRNVIEIEWYVTLLLTCVTMPRKIFGLMVYKSAKQYFMNIDNVLDAIVVVSVFVTSFVYTGRTYDWQNYVGAFAILCAWTNLMLMVGQLPAFGTYVAMFTHIQFEFAKLLLAYSGLLIGFTISFCVIFVGEPSFGNPFTGLIKVLAMMAGELDFEGLINQDDIMHDGSFVLYHPLSVCSQILFTLFIVFVTVILMNLLVGIAVHDIQGLRNHAGLTKLVRQTKLILFTEMVLYSGRIPYTFRKWMFNDTMDEDSRKKMLVVKPLNPLEKRLPKDILKAAYTIAQRNAPLLGDDEQDDDEVGTSLNERVGWMKRVQIGEINCNDRLLHSTMDQLCAQIKLTEDDMVIIKEQILDTNKTLKSLVAKARRTR